MSANVPGDLAENGDPEDVAPMVVYLCSDNAKGVNGQVYTVVGGRISIWSQPREIRHMNKDGRWTPAEIEARFGEVGTDRLAMLDWIDANNARIAALEATQGVGRGRG